MLSGYEISRAAAQAGVAAEDIPSLLRHLGVGPGGLAVDALSDILLGHVTPSAPAGPKQRPLSKVAATAPTERTLIPPPSKFLQLVQDAKNQADYKVQVLQFLQSSPGDNLEQKETDAVAFCLSIPARDLYSIVDGFGSTVLVLACRLGMQQLFQVILTTSASSQERSTFVNKPNDMGWTPLLLAAQNGYRLMCEELLWAQADPNLPTEGTRLSPLTLAASYGHADTVRLLLDLEWTRPPTNRAHPWMLSSDGRSALHFVRARLQCRMKLVDDGEDQRLDSYSVRKPRHAELPEDYSNIERMLVAAMRVVPPPPGFEAAVQDEFLRRKAADVSSLRAPVTRRKQGMGATASVEAPSADDLKRLYDKHDITGSGHLEKQEAFALLEDLRIRYGMEEELPESFKEAVFQDFDEDSAGTWSWHDVRVLSGEGWPAMRRRLQRLRVRGGQRHNRAQRQKEQTFTESAASAWSKVSGAGAAVAALKEVEKAPDLEEEVQLDFHPLRIQNISIGRFLAVGLSSVALRHNRAFAASFEAASLDCSEQPRTTFSSRRMSAKIERAPVDVEQICSRLAAVRRNHLLFVSGEIEAPEPDGEPVPAKAKQHARPAASSGEGSELTSRSQRMAQKRFYDIDVGKLDAQSVFERVAGAPDRVNTKLCFFRDRPDLVLPIIEEEFIVRDEKRDCEVLDLPRLRGAQSARTPRKKVQAVPSSASLKTVLSEDDAVYDSAEEKCWQDSSQGQGYLPVAEPRTLQHVVSMASVNTRPSEHSSLETGEQRSLRIVRAARIRDERIQIAQKAVRSNELQWRLHHLKCFRDKEQRKELQLLASRQQTLLECMAVAIAAQRLLKAMQLARDRRLWYRQSESKAPLATTTKSKAHWLRAKKIVSSSLTEKDGQGDLQEIFNSRAKRSKAAWERWDHLLRIMKFLAKLKYRSNLTRSACAIKQFIEGAWRGMRFRARVGAYLYNVRALQRAMRAAIKFRVQVRSFIYLPTLWEVETQLLGEKLMAHLPKGYTKQRIQTHRQTWDLEGRIRLLQEAAKERRIPGLGRKGYMVEKRKTTNKTATPRATRLGRRRNAQLRPSERPERMVVFSELGEAIPTTSAERKQQQALMIANNVLDHYRLDIETRNDIVKTLFIQSLHRWKENYRAYLVECKRLNKVWQQWRLEVQALGPQRKEHWPKPPPSSQPPSEMYNVDTRKLRGMIIAALAQSQLGRSLFARDIRRVSNS
ncbi:ANKRD50 [Symbiodinium sp. KB8]|nr:ANKRD50 [Symbiodinium sp. KB8]